MGHSGSSNPDSTWKSWLVIHSTSVRTMEAVDTQLRAHDTSNHSTWQVLNLSGGNDGQPWIFHANTRQAIRSTLAQKIP